MFDFWIILCACLVAVNSSLLGSFLMLKKMSMVGDALSHSVLPGIVIAFLITHQYSSFTGILLASALGVLAVFIMNTLSKQGGFQRDSAIGITYTLLFSIGIILISSFARNADIDVECVLFGDIGNLPFSDSLELFSIEVPKQIIGLFIFSLVNVIIVIRGIKGFSISSFDPLLTSAMGISLFFWDYLLLGLASVNTVFSFDAVGAIMVISMLVIPAGFAHLFTKQIRVFLRYAVLFSVSCSIIGYYLSILLNVNIVATISVLMACIFFSCIFILKAKKQTSKKA